jgi:transcriptional/translational regulatory protein YebC/TACO1
LVPSNLVVCDIEVGTRVFKLIESIDDHDDVQKVYSNADIPREVMVE